LTRLPYLLFAVALGAMIAIQPGLNADVARRLGTPVGAAFLSVTVAFVLSAAYMLLSRHAFPLAAVAALPWYLWLGGLMGFVFVIGALFVAPELGGALLFAAIVLGQMIAAALADYYGIGGYPARELDPFRIAGIVLVVAGVFLFQRAG
jgi:transporter family-2 protein